jgi:predicted TIM-barrel fold metal-dependent hydrolase
MFVVDADSHALEPPWLWEEYLEERYKSRAIRIARPAEGGPEQLLVAIDTQCDLHGEDKVLWGSDHPHIDSHIDAADRIRASVAGLSEARKRAVLGENARSLFQL